RDGHPGDEREREGAVHERLAELRALGVRRVEVDLVRVQRQAREPDVVHLGDGAAEAALEDVTDGEVLVEPPPPVLRRLAHAPLPSLRTRRARRTTGRSIISPFTASTPSRLSSKASTTRRAHATSRSLGRKTRLTIGTCLG